MGVCIITRRGGSAGGNVMAIGVASAENLPSSAKEGTIAVITNTAVGNVYVQNTEPDSPAAGDVWVNTGVSSDAPILIGNVTVYPSAVKQYVDGAWISCDAKVYTNGAWTDLWAGFLYKSGDEFERVTGGWVINNKGSKEADYILVGSSSQPATSSYVTHSTPVDFTSYTTLSVHFITAVSNSSVGAVRVKIFDESQAEVLSANVVVGEKTVNDVTANLDISALEGNYYVRVIANHGTSGSNRNIQGQFDWVRCE